jgi:predicted ATPase
VLVTLAVSGYRSLRDVVVPLGELTVISGANGSGKSNLYRALRLLASTAIGGLIGSIAREGGLPSLLWAGPEFGGTQGTVRKNPVAVRLGFASDELGYLVDLGIPQIDQRNLFARDPEIKREQVFAGPVARPATLLIDRTRAHTRVRGDEWVSVRQELMPWESIVTDLADGDTAPELLVLRRMLGSWRFYDSFRVDGDAPVRHPQVGTRTQTLAHDGSNLAAVWATITDHGFGGALDDAIGNAFRGTRAGVEADAGQFRLLLRQPGLLRPLELSEVSDGTLRYLLLCAALLPARPAPLIVLNEPESSLHPDLIEPLGELIATASKRTQVIVVTHSARLLTALASTGASRVELKISGNGTAVDGQGMLEAPAWNWGSR